MNSPHGNENLAPYDYYCNMCGKPGVAWYDTSCPRSQVEQLGGLLCCDSCLDSYESAVRDNYRRNAELARQRMGLEVKKHEEEEMRETVLEAPPRECKHWYMRD